MDESLGVLVAVGIAALVMYYAMDVVKERVDDYKRKDNAKNDRNGCGGGSCPG